MSTPADFNAQVIEEFRANDGVVGGMFAGAPMVLVHHVGAKTGTERVTPLVYLPDGEDYVIFASKAGAPTNPDWYHNLRANPRTTIEVGGDTIDVTVEEVTGAERDRLFDAQVAAMPQFAEYAKATDRVIPVLVLHPVG